VKRGCEFKREKGKLKDSHGKWGDIHVVTPNSRSDPYSQYWFSSTILPDN
jgi:hypothetical protein